MTTKERLHQLIDSLPETAVAEVERYLESLAPQTDVYERTAEDGPGWIATSLVWETTSPTIGDRRALQPAGRSAISPVSASLSRTRRVGRQAPAAGRPFSSPTFLDTGPRGVNRRTCAPPSSSASPDSWANLATR